MRVSDQATGFAGRPMEFKNSRGNRGTGHEDDGAEDLETLRKAFETHHEATKGVAGDLKALTDRLDEFEKKQNRLRLAGVPAEQGKIDRETAIKFRSAIGDLVRTGESRKLDELREEERKALSVGSDPDGGYLTSPVLSTMMTARLRDQSPMRNLARVETITTGDAFEEPLDLDDVDATWVGEKQARPATGTAKVGMLTVPVHEIYALQPVTQRLLDDSGFDIGGWVEGKIADKFGRSEGAACVVGNGDYLWRDGMTAGASPSLLGRPVEFDENMPAVGAGALPIAFGDWKQGYLIVDKMGAKFLRDPYTDKPNVLFYYYRRTGGAVANFDAIKLLKVAA